MTPRPQDNFGYTSEEPCRVCGKHNNNQSEPRFGYTVCEEHQNVAPVDIPAVVVLTVRKPTQAEIDLHLAEHAGDDGVEPRIGRLYVRRHKLALKSKQIADLKYEISLLKLIHAQGGWGEIDGEDDKAAIARTIDRLDRILLLTMAGSW